MARHCTHARNASDDLLLFASAHISSPDSKPRCSQCSLQAPPFLIMFSLRPSDQRLPPGIIFRLHRITSALSPIMFAEKCILFHHNKSYFIITTRRDLTSPTRYLPGCPDDARLRDRPPSQPRTARSPVHDCTSTHKPRRPLENPATCTVDYCLTLRRFILHSFTNLLPTLCLCCNFLNPVAAQGKLHVQQSPGAMPRGHPGFTQRR